MSDQHRGLEGKIVKRVAREGRTLSDKVEWVRGRHGLRNLPFELLSESLHLTFDSLPSFVKW